MTTEDLIQALGKPGKFQVLLYIMLGSNFIFVCWNHLGMAFLGAKTKHHCRVANDSQVAQLVPVIMKDGVKMLDGCHLYSDYNKTSKVPCSSWTYQQPDREHTIIAEWDLVCDNAYKTSLSTTVYFCGVALSTLVFGTLSDKFGRRPIILFTMYLPLLVGLALFLIRYYVAFVVFRFLLGFLLQGLQMTSFIAVVELLAIQYRTVVGVLVGVFWSIGIMSLSLIAYTLQDWRHIQLFTMFGCLFQIGLICFLPESSRWLLTKKRFVEAEAVIQKIAKFNNKEFPRKIFDEVVESIEDIDTETLKPSTHYTIIDLFRISVLRLRTLVMALVWYVARVSGLLRLVCNSRKANYCGPEIDIAWSFKKGAHH